MTDKEKIHELEQQVIDMAIEIVRLKKIIDKNSQKIKNLKEELEKSNFDYLDAMDYY
jgi:TolA-binding protein